MDNARQIIDDIRREIGDFEGELNCIISLLEDMDKSGELNELYGEYPADYIEEDILGPLNNARDALHEFRLNIL